MDTFHFVWNAATSYVTLTRSLSKEQETNTIQIDANSTPKKEIMEWVSSVGWEKISCMDESIFMTEKERVEWETEREESPNAWMDFLAVTSDVYESTVQSGGATNLIWDHILSVSLTTWDSMDDTVGMKSVAQTPDESLEGDNRHIKEVIRALKRIRQAEMDPEASKKIGEDEDETEVGGQDGGDEFDDEVLLGLQSKMKDMLGKIQDPESGLGKLMKEIMDELKGEKLDLDPKTLMDVCMKTMTGGMTGGAGGLDALKDGPLGKIMTIVESKVKEKVEAGGMDELKSILDSTKDILGKNPEEMKETLVRILQSMVKKMGLPKQAQQMLFGKMNGIIEQMTNTFVNKDGPAPSQEDMQKMLSSNMNDVVRQVLSQQGAKVSNRKAQRMAARGGLGAMGGRRNPQLERLEKLKERLRKKHAQMKKKDT